MKARKGETTGEIGRAIDSHALCTLTLGTGAAFSLDGPCFALLGSWGNWGVFFFAIAAILDLALLGGRLGRLDLLGSGGG
jgi:hypothetical protein